MDCGIGSNAVARDHLNISIDTTAMVMKAAMELGEFAVLLSQSIHLIKKVKKARMSDAHNILTRRE